MQHQSCFHITAIFYQKYHFPLDVLSSIIPLFSSEGEILLLSQLLWILNCYNRSGLFRSFLLPQLHESKNNTRHEECVDTMRQIYEGFAPFISPTMSFSSPLFVILFSLHYVTIDLLTVINNQSVQLSLISLILLCRSCLM